MKKKYYIPAIIIAVIAIAYIVVVLINPELTLPVNPILKGLIYGLVFVVIASLLFLSVATKEYLKKEYIISFVLALLAIVFVCLSMTKLKAEGESNWFLPVGLFLNVISMSLSNYARKKYQRND